MRPPARVADLRPDCVTPRQANRPCRIAREAEADAAPIGGDSVEHRDIPEQSDRLDAQPGGGPFGPVATREVAHLPDSSGPNSRAVADRGRSDATAGGVDLGPDRTGRRRDAPSRP
jgi:hypothetical protein